MQAEAPARWPYRDTTLSYREAVDFQAQVSARIVQRWNGTTPSLVAGVDVGLDERRAHAAVVVLTFPGLELVEIARAERELGFPYIPGLLAFREIPTILDAFARLRASPELVFVDGQGRAHPRRCGVACHVGVELDLPAIGIGKSRLCGEHAEPGLRRGCATRLVHEGEVIGKVLRTRDRVRPVFVSVGHRIDLAHAERFALRSATRFRLPEPVRLADRATRER